MFRIVICTWRDLSDRSPDLAQIRSTWRYSAAAVFELRTPEDIGSQAGGGGDIYRAVLVDIHGGHVRAHAGPVVDEFRNELGPTRRLFVPHHPVPIDHCGPIRVRVVVAEVRHEALAHDEVLDAVAVDIYKSGPMRLGKQNIAGILGVEIVHEDMSHEADFTRWAALLLEPREPPA